MSVGKAAFVVTPPPPVANLPLDEILGHYACIRDAIAAVQHVESESLPVLVANASFGFAFNSFKAINLLLPLLFYEAASPVVRQMWEVSLNSHWMFADADRRVTEFCGYTIMEYRKLLQRQAKGGRLEQFDEAARAFRLKYSFTNRSGKERQYPNYSNLTAEQRARELGEPWRSDYTHIYNLTSMYAHGAPGAILNPVFRSYYGNPKDRERDSSALLAIVAIKTMMLDVELMARHGIVVDPTGPRREYDAFIKTLERTPAPEK